MFMLGVMYTWSLFRELLLEKYDWSEGRQFLTLSIVAACFEVGGLMGRKFGEWLFIKEEGAVYCTSSELDANNAVFLTYPKETLYFTLISKGKRTTCVGFPK